MKRSEQSPQSAPSLEQRNGPLVLFALNASERFGTVVAQVLGLALAPHEEREFEDGEHKVRPLQSVRGADVYVIHSLYGEPGRSANDKLCRLLFFISTLKDQGARSVTAVVPYLCYARKDRRTKPYDPITIRYVASLFEAAGADAVIVLDVHNPAAFESAFRCRTISLTAAPLFVEFAKALSLDGLCVVSPDPGGVKRAELFREVLEASLGRPVGKAFADKRRSAGVVSGELFVGDAAGTTALIIDDLISTGTTLLRAARSARAAGAKNVIALVTHGLFMTGAAESLADPAIDKLIVTDSVPPFRLKPGPALDKVQMISAVPLVAEAIRRLSANESLADLGVN
jgi:ribose-phosphate pyrophosphokinase